MEGLSDEFILSGDEMVDVDNLFSDNEEERAYRRRRGNVCCSDIL